MIITELGLSQRTEHALRRNGIHSTEQLTQMGDAQILRLRGMGPIMLREIREKLARPERSDAEELAAYRATGLTPEEIKNHEAAYNECLTRTYGPFKQKINQWLRAEKEGRLVVLPCGTDVNLVRDGHTYKADHWNHTLTAFRDAPENKSGKKVALFSIKEAEAALERKEINDEKTDH